MTRRLGLLVVAALLACGCAPDDPFSGIWHSPDASPLVWTDYSVTADTELLVGVYDTDAAGMLRFFTPGSGFQKNMLLEALPCLYLDEASASKTALSFNLTAADGKVWAGLLRLSDDEQTLSGTLTLQPETVPPTVVNLSLLRTGDQDQIDEQGLNKECPAPSKP